MTDRERMIEVIKQAFPQTNEGIADALIAAGFISLKASAEMAREACDILRNIKDDEIKCICEERDALARRAEVAERALLTACVSLIKDEADNVNLELLARVVYTMFLRKAEKELAEEKDD